MKQSIRFSIFIAVTAIFLIGQSLFAMDPIIRNEAYKEQVKTYDRVESILNLSLAANTAITPSDTVSTGTADVAYLTGRFSYPIELEIQVHGDNPLYYGVYSTDATGTYIPDVGAGALLMDVNGAACSSNKHAKMRFFRRPNLSFGGGASPATATFIIRTLKGEEY